MGIKLRAGAAQGSDGHMREAWGVQACPVIDKHVCELWVSGRQA